MNKLFTLIIFSVLFLVPLFPQHAFALPGDFIDSFASGGGLDAPLGLIFGPDGNLYVNSSFTDEVLRYEPPLLLIGGTLMPIDTTALLLVGTQMTAAWLIPVIVAGIGITIVIARKL